MKVKAEIATITCIQSTLKTKQNSSKILYLTPKILKSQSHGGKKKPLKYI